MSQQERITAMADILVAFRRADTNADMGTFIASALHLAAEKLGSAELLVLGRPGSWEADIIRKMATLGGSGNIERIVPLSALFVLMGESGEDGGDVLSQAMSEAVDRLGGLDQFSGGSPWHWDLVNMGCQYSSHWND